MKPKYSAIEKRPFYQEQGNLKYTWDYYVPYGVEAKLYNLDKVKYPLQKRFKSSGYTINKIDPEKILIGGSIILLAVYIYNGSNF